MSETGDKSDLTRPPQTENGQKPDKPIRLTLESQILPTHESNDQERVESLLKRLSEHKVKIEPPAIQTIQTTEQKQNSGMRFINTLIYPSNKTMDRHYINLLLAGFVGIPSSLIIGLATSSGTAALAIYAGSVALTIPSIIMDAIQRRHMTKVDNIMTVVKAVSERSRILSSGASVEKGDLIGELHIEGANEHPEWRRLSERERGFAFLEAALKSFIELRERCQDQNFLPGIKVLYGESDLVKPPLVRRLGFVETEELKMTLSKKIRVRIKRIRALGLIKGATSPIGNLNAIWIDRTKLIESLEQISQLTKRLEKRRSDSPINNGQDSLN